MISCAVAFGAWLASSWIKSPAEVAAQTAPPRPSPILVPIEKRVLSSKIVARGTARFGLPQQVSLPPSILKLRVGLITTLPLLNTVVNEGDVLLTASGRPVFVLQGKLTAYRDLTPGISGKDVRQLEQALERLGYAPGPVDGVFDRQTSAAVKAWYEASGLEPFGPTPDQLKAVRALEKQWNDAQKIRFSAVAAESSSVLGIENARAKAERNQKAAVADLGVKTVALQRLKARFNLDKKRLRATGKDVKEQVAHSTERPSMRSAKAIAERNNIAAAADLDSKRAALRSLQGTRKTAGRAVEVAKKVAAHNNRVALAAFQDIRSKGEFLEKDLAEARMQQARSAASKAKIEGELAVIRTQREAESLEDKIKLAETQVKLAEAAIKSTLLEGERAIQVAAVDSSVVQGELQAVIKQVALAEVTVTATRLDGKVAIQSAMDTAEIAKIEAKFAKQREERAKRELDQARIRIGVQVPVDEFIFLPRASGSRARSQGCSRR